MAPTATTTRPKRSRAKKTTTTVLTLVLDESGSMDDPGTTMRADTIDGLNLLLEEQRAVDGRMLVSIVTFSYQARTPVVLADVHDVEPFTEASYRPMGGTALYDAVGLAIEGMDGYLANNPGESVLPVIAVWTDGMNNASKRWSLHALNQAIEERRDRGWTFMFLGAGGSAWTEGDQFVGTMGAPMVVRASCDSMGTYGSYAGVSATLTSARNAGNFNSVNLANAVADAQTDGTVTEWQARRKSRTV